jgi:hypothetical protein
MRPAALVIVAVGAAGLTAYDQYDKRVNFQRVDARISAINDQCYMEKVAREGITKTTSTSEPLRCELAQILTREHPRWQGYAVKHKIAVRFVFISPVDGATHTSSLEMSAFPNGQLLRAGDVLPVLASKTKADETRAI